MKEQDPMFPFVFGLFLVFTFHFYGQKLFLGSALPPIFSIISYLSELCHMTLLTSITSKTNNINLILLDIRQTNQDSILWTWGGSPGHDTKTKSRFYH